MSAVRLAIDAEVAGAFADVLRAARDGRRTHRGPLLRQPLAVAMA